MPIPRLQSRMGHLERKMQAAAGCDRMGPRRWTTHSSMQQVRGVKKQANEVSLHMQGALDRHTVLLDNDVYE